MKYSICIPALFGGRTFREAVRCIAHYGFDTAEIWDWTGLDIPEAQEVLAENSVSLAGMCTTEFRLTDGAYRDAYLKGVEESCEAGKKLGIRFLISQAGPDTGAPREEQHENIVKTLELAGPVASSYGLSLLIEPLNTYFDHPGYYLTTSGEGAAIVRETGCTGIRMLFDIYHQQIMEGNLIPNIKENLDVIAHFHAAGHPGRHELSSGEVDYRRVFRAIRELGYKDYIGLEYFPELPPEQSLTEFRREYITPLL